MSKEPKIVSNFDENTHLGMSIITCRLFDLMALNPKEYFVITNNILYNIKVFIYGSTLTL